jgi:hypothetical protein
MAEPDSVARVVAGLDDATRFTFRRIALKEGPVSERTLLQSLPFSEEALAEHLADLEARGLIWRLAPIGRGDEGRRWFIPSDLERALSPPRNRPPPTARVPPVGHALDEQAATRKPDLSALPMAPQDVEPSGAARRVIGALARGDASSQAAEPPEANDQARLWARALSIIKAAGRSASPGPKVASWLALSDHDQTQVLLRLWLVEDTRTVRAIPSNVRRALVDVLGHAVPGTWYDVISVSRAVARGLATSRTSVDDRVAIRQREIDQALERLCWLGAIDLGRDDRRRLVGFRLTSAGADALAKVNP